MENLKPYAIKILITLFKNANLPVRRDTNRNIYINNLDVKNNVNTLYYHILNHTYATSTKRDYLIILSNVFKNSNKTLYEYIYKKAKEYNKIHYADEVCQELDKNELLNYVEYSELNKKLMNLIDEYNSNPTLKNIINVLVLALYVLQPPLRNDYANIILINNEKDETDKTRNYLLKSKDIYYIILNNDKVISKHGRGEIPITNKILVGIINLYLNSYAKNNKYLFENKNKTPYTKKQIQYIINKFFKDECKTLNIYNLRSAYITDFYKNNLDLHSRTILANYMRHSKNTAELVYCKFF